MFKNIGFRILSAIVLLAAIAGIAYFAFNAGVAQGATLNLQVPAAGGQAVPYFAYGMPYRMHPFFGFGLLGLLVPLFLLFLAFGAARRMIWGSRWGGHHMHYRQWDDKTSDAGFVPPMFAEWHRRAHGSAENPGDSGAQK